jgi:hypothetical protein
MFASYTAEALSHGGMKNTKQSSEPAVDPLPRNEHACPGGVLSIKA